MLSDRGKRDDILWFTLFHEIAHLIKHGTKEVFLDEDDTEKNDMEKEADNYSKNILIPNKEYISFLEKNTSFTNKSIIDFAKSINVSPGIVIGRLQNDQLIDWNEYSNLIVRI